MRTILTTTALGIGLTTAAAAAPNPYAKEDRSWISIRGTVGAVTADAFELDYGEGFVTVEMDDFAPDADGYKLLEGDEVTVYGRIDDDTFETTSIEASSVWVQGLNTYFFANSADEEELPAVVTLHTIDYDLKLTGTIHDVDGSEFTLDTGRREMRVDTDELGYDPFDDEGYQKLDKGDRVSVTGNINNDWWDSRELMAETIVTLEDKSES